MQMNSLLSLADTLVKKVFPTDKFSVIEVQIKNYTNYQVIDTSESIYFYQYPTESSSPTAPQQNNYEIVFTKDAESKIAFRFVID